jgi:hypothetical protein
MIRSELGICDFCGQETQVHPVDLGSKMSGFSLCQKCDPSAIWVDKPAHPRRVTINTTSGLVAVVVTLGIIGLLMAVAVPALAMAKRRQPKESKAQ